MVQTLIWLSVLLAATSATQYECLPYPEKSTCIIDFIYYLGGEPITFPTGYDHYRITSRSEKQITSNVTIFDETLYEAMHRPSRIEMANTNMQSLTLPPELQLGNFAANKLSSVTTEAGRHYQISYLDLESNNLKDIAFINRLVNLEVLHLDLNQISSIPGSAVAPLTKLKYLYLQFNPFTSIPWTDLPRTLIHLDCYYCHVESAEFTNVSLPSLEYLGLQHNAFTTINVTDLLRVAPRLKEAHLQNNVMTEHERDRINAKLTSNNISFVYSSPLFTNYCYYDDYEFKDGTCVRRQLASMGTGMTILLSGVVIGMAATFVYIVVLTFRHMNR
ncbi:uncharacterized protein LOC135705603 [Ochlerotatus camptorhynchus]|uniref:uncharacterized protein LOC135705603 n=1 Tax=Ochlerotatus camptorhynchus TaxID=644619 RepID=UPI0031DE080C